MYVDAVTPWVCLSSPEYFYLSDFINFGKEQKENLYFPFLQAWQKAECLIRCYVQLLCKSNTSIPYPMVPDEINQLKIDSIFN